MRRNVMATIALVAMLTTVLVLAGLGPAASQQSVTTLQLNFPDSEPRTMVDIGRKGESVGDSMHFAGRVTDEDGARVGNFIGEATIYKSDFSRAQMVGTLSLKGRGRLSIQGYVNFNQRHQGIVAITGGTREFGGARGTVDVTIQRNGNVNLEVRLLN